MYYEFYSTSENNNNNNILKCVIFTHMKSNIYNLALVDITDDGNFYDKTLSNNGGIMNIIATFYEIINDFLDKYPSFMISIIGNTDKKTNIYSKLVTKYYNQLNKQYQLNGILNKKPFYFEQNVIYDEIYISKRRKYVGDKIIYEMKNPRLTIVDKEIPEKILEYGRKMAAQALEIHEKYVEPYMVNGEIIVPEENIPKKKKKKNDN